MNLLREFDIEFVKLKEGNHHFEFVVKDDFFKAFESSLSVHEIKVDIDFIKNTSMFTLNFTISGKINTECDRCLNDLQLPIFGEYQLLVKITDSELEDEDDLIYIGSSDYKINIAQHLFDYIYLSIPIKKTCNDIGRKCDPAIEEKITMVIDVDTTGDDLPERDSDFEEETL
ncbi:MAG: DUF177 domain-containing protein [Bacteroidota bacterium]|nr:DUF177 domain-containing protein [Bacteroidota bacterium]